MRINGKCHCGNITYKFDWPSDDPNPEIPTRRCSCSFCTKHGGTYTSHRSAKLGVEIAEPTAVSRYRFATQTAEFYICSRCGVVPFITSLIAERKYAVVNVNTFEGLVLPTFQESTTDFSGETTEDRLQRRAATWIPNVTC